MRLLSVCELRLRLPAPFVPVPPVLFVQLVHAAHFQNAEAEAEAEAAQVHLASLAKHVSHSHSHSHSHLDIWIHIRIRRFGKLEMSCRARALSRRGNAM